MVIIWGTRPYFGSGSVTQHGFCGQCGNYGKLKSTSPLVFFHLYYLPLIPTRGRRRHHKTCSKCNMYEEYELEQHEMVTQAMKDHAADALVALASGETEFQVDGDESEEMSECVRFLHGAFDWLYAAGEKEFCDGLIGQLGGASPSSGSYVNYAHHALTGVLSSMRGRVDSAIESFETAITHQADLVYPYEQMGHLLVIRKRRAEAAAAYEKALKHCTDSEQRISLLVQLVDEQMASKQFAEAAATYDEIEQAYPELMQDKSVQKSRKKARKKAGLD